MLQMKLCGDLVLREKCEPITEITPDVLDILDDARSEWGWLSCTSGWAA